MTGGRVLPTGAPELCVTDGELILRNRAGSCRVDLATGKTEFVAASPRLRGAIKAEPFAATAAGEITTRGSVGKPSWRRHPARPGEACAVIVRRGLLWRIAAGDHHFAVSAGTDDSRAPVTRLGVRFRGGVLSRIKRPHLLRVAYCGAHSQSDLSRSEVVPLTRGPRVRSWWTTAVFDGESEVGCVVGFLAARRFAGEIEGRFGELEASHATENRRPARRDVLWSEPIFFAPTERARDSLLEYGRQVGVMNGRRGAAAPAWGWGSWGHFHDAVTTRLALRNAAELTRLDLRGAGEPLVHIDHGWEERFQPHRPAPTWRARPEFGGELAALAKKLRGRARLGAWVVPFAINSSGPLPREFHAAVLCDAAGHPQPVIGRECYCVDPTSPTGERWLRALFTRLKRAGVTHYKLDFLRVLLATDPADARDGVGQPRPFHAPVTRVEAYRRGLQIIRDVVGPQAHLLACGAPLLPGAGLVDSVRIGSDITPEWETGRTGIRHCAENVRGNFFWHGRVWDNDADFLVLPREPRLLRYWAAAVAFSGGLALVSADLPTLPPARRRLLARFFPGWGAAPRPLELRSRHGGVRVACPLGDGEEATQLVACFNSTARPRRFTLDAVELGIPIDTKCIAWDVLAERPLGTDPRRWTIGVGGRDVQVIAVRRRLARPQFLGSSGHIASEQVELAAVNWQERTRTLRLSRRSERAWPERLFFHVPPAFAPRPRKDVRFARKSGLLTLDLRGSSTRTIALSFDFLP